MASASRRRRSSGVGILLVLVAVLYGAGALVAGAILLSLADAWWLGTVLVYGPRWPLLAPALVLVPLLALARRPLAAALTVLVGVFVAWPVMGWVPPVGGDGSEGGRALGVRIVTLNAQGAELSDPRIVRLIEDHEPDVVAIQECGTRDDAAPVPSGYHLRAVSPLCFLSKFPFVRVDARDQSDVYARYGSGEIVLAELETPAGPIFVQNVHLETVREGLEAILHDRLAGIPEMEKNIEQRRWESELAREWARRAKGPLVIAGDFNLPVESAIYDRYWADLANAFSHCGSGYGNTKETRVYGVRIDHVLFDERWACTSAQVGPRIGSDHRPMVVDLELIP